MERLGQWLDTELHDGHRCPLPLRVLGVVLVIVALTAWWVALSPHMVSGVHNNGIGTVVWLLAGGVAFVVGVGMRMMYRWAAAVFAIAALVAFVGSLVFYGLPPTSVWGTYFLLGSLSALLVVYVLWQHRDDLR